LADGEAQNRRMTMQKNTRDALILALMVTADVVCG